MLKIRRKAIIADTMSLGLTLAAAFGLLILSILLLSKEPGKALYYIFFGPFTNKYYLGNWINASVPLIFTGLGIALAFRASLFNLGGEGQVYAGGLAAFLFAQLLVGAPPIIVIITALAGSALAGGFLAGLSGYFKMKWRTDELISSFLISNAVILVINQLITGPLQDPETNLLATKPFQEGVGFLPILPPSYLNLTLILAIVVAAVVFLYLFRSHQGYEIRISGLNHDFAKYGGIPINRYFLLPLLWSGALHGLAGSVAVMGTYGKVLKGFSGGMGWNGIAVALIARNHPLWVIPAALFFAYLESGAKIAMIHTDITLEVSTIAQAVVFFLITSRWIREKFLYSRRSK